jgi:tripeptidyl-peptidase-1
VCSLLLQLGLRGVSLLFAGGVGGVGQGNCIDTSGNVRFLPLFPATCTYGLFLSSQAVYKLRDTSLTTRPRFCRSLVHYLWRNKVGYKPEAAAPFSGGGFSDYFLRPDYQQEVVSSFLQVQTLEDEYKGLYKRVCLHP